MAVYIESRYTDGYITHHAQDMIRVNILHRPEDGYLLSHDREVIKEQLPLTDFIQRLRHVEGAQRESLEQEIKRIDDALRLRREREICDWLDRRYSKIIREKQAVLMEHTHSVNMRHVELTGQFHRETETVSSSGRSITQSKWDADRVMRHMDEMGMYPQTTDEAYEKIPKTGEVKDKEVYYLLT